MSKIIKFVYLLVILSFFLHKSFAQEIDWMPKGSFYLTTGYSLTHELYRPLQETLTNIQPPITYNIQNTYPNNLSGMRFGFGARFGSKTSHYGYELDFNQVFEKARITSGLKITRPEKIVIGFVDYTINPQSRFQWILAGGGVITTVPLTTTTIAPNQASSSTSTTTSVDPAIAGVVLYHINSAFAVKGVFIYKIAPYDTSIRGTLIPLLMVNYYPNI